jgi:hypothetical protein
VQAEAEFRFKGGQYAAHGVVETSEKAFHLFLML